MKQIRIKSLDQCIQKKLVKKIYYYNEDFNKYDFNTPNSPGIANDMLPLFGKIHNADIIKGKEYFFIPDSNGRQWTWPKEVIEEIFEFKQIKII